MKLTAAVVTSTVGRPVLRKAIESVAAQTRKARHYIFVDGPQYTQAAMDVITDTPVADDTVVMNLPNNTGANLYTCSHINAMAPFIVNEDIVIYLDDDNWFEPEHVETIVGMVERHNLDWGSSLRNIVDHQGNHGCKDECESLSMFPNRSGQRRTGVALRYMPATSLFDRQLKPVDGKSGLPVSFATRRLWLLRGEDRTGQNDFSIGHRA